MSILLDNVNIERSKCIISKENFMNFRKTIDNALGASVIKRPAAPGKEREI